MRLLACFVALTFCSLRASPSVLAQSDLEAGFVKPAGACRPHTWWHWMNGNITKEGITLDLEAMHEVGIGGAQIFNVSESIPAGPVLFMSPEWRALVKHAASEAARLGIELTIHNCAGWSSSGGPWITPEHAMQMVVTSESTVDGGRELTIDLPQPESRCDYYRDIAVLAFPTPADDTTRIPDWRAKAGFDPRYGLGVSDGEAPAQAIVPLASIVDLTASATADRLKWNAPAGHWTIVRFGYTPTGKTNHPSPDSGRGLECDKLSRAGLDQHWNGIMAPILADLGELAPKALKSALVDSYEVGLQNWTAAFREEFRARRAYDLLPYLVTLTGRYVENAGESERFLWDYRKTIAELFAANYYDYFAELCHAHGLVASMEPYDGPFECLNSGRSADIPMGEFWVGGGETSSCTMAASLAHVYGRPFVGAESFTAEPSRGKWTNVPANLKALGDLQFAAGVNRLIFHRYAHQPWTDLVPGMTMGQWGTHFERTVTWWHQSRAWLDYLARSQFLLQGGFAAADVLAFVGENAPSSIPDDWSLKARGYAFDYCSLDALEKRVSVAAKQLVLPNGATYRVLWIPETQAMTRAALVRLHALVDAGATLVAERPGESPSLTDRGAGAAEVRRLTDLLWGPADGDPAPVLTVGAGRVVRGRTMDAVIEALAIAPDVEWHSEGTSARLAWIHRRLPGADVYFVSNQQARARTVEATFRIDGRVPEIWDAVSGEIADAPIWSAHDAVTAVRLDLEPAGSRFVVFRRSVGATDPWALVSAPSSIARRAQITIQRAVYEAIDGAGSADVTAKVAALVADGELAITASNALFGDPTVMHLKRLRVDFTLDAQPMTRTVEENEVLELAAEPAVTLSPWRIDGEPKAGLQLTAFVPGTYSLRSAAGRKSTFAVENVPEPKLLDGPWTVRFEPHRGAPESITLAALHSLSEDADSGVKYFSGTATYSCEFSIEVAALDPMRAAVLDLGRVAVLADVSVNGQAFGVVWRPPFLVDVSRALRAGVNRIDIAVTNTWANRLIGDEQLPDDCKWNGIVLEEWPKWLLEGTPRPSKDRITFTTWKHYQRDSLLPESGLVGPVRLVFGLKKKIE
jgi:hypothetical protein